MTRRIIASLAAAGVAILASCSQDQRPSALLPTEASLTKAPPSAPSCSFTTSIADAKNYFTSSTGSTKDPVFGLLDAMNTLYKADPKSAATKNAGFDVLNRVAGAVGTTAVNGTPSQGSLFVNDVLLCMNVAHVFNKEQFTKSLAAPTIAVPVPDTKGLFAIRDGSTAAAVVSRPLLFGAEPSTGNWPLTQRVLFYGWSTTPSAAFDDTPVGTVFELRTVPTQITFSPGIRLGSCDISDKLGRILHLHTGSQPSVLPQADLGFCPTPPAPPAPQTVGSTSSSSSIFALATQQLGSWLAPKPAFAASRRTMFLLLKAGGCCAGTLSEFGPIQFTDTLVVQPDPFPGAAVSDTALALDTLPHADGDPVQLNTATSQFPGVTVTATTKVGKNALAGVLIKLNVIGNKGSFAAVNDTGTTDAAGVARFPNFYINKAGGYTITATAPEFGTVGAWTTNLFNISGQ